MSDNKSKQQNSEFNGVDYSYLYADTKDEDVSYREFPKMGKAESIFSLIIHIIGILSGITFLVTGLYYTLTDKNNFPASNDGYSAGGIASIILIALAIIALCVYSYFYTTNFAMKKEHKTEKAIMSSLWYVMIASIVTGYSLICLRPGNVSSFNNVYGGILTYVGYLITAIIWVAAVVGIVLNFKSKKAGLVTGFNYAFIALPLWIMVCFYAIMAKDYCVSKNGMRLVIIAPIVMDIALIFLATSKKKAGMHTTWNLVSFGAIAMEVITLLYFGIAIPSLG